MSSVIELFKSLAVISSPSFKEANLANYIKATLEKYDIHYVQDQGHQQYKQEKANTGNLIVTLQGDKPQTISFCAHMDTVNPCDQVILMEEGDWLKTDGNCILGGDDKAGIAVILDCLIKLKKNNKPHPTIIAIFTFGEEVGLKGAKVLDFKQLPPIDYSYVIDAGGEIGSAYASAPYSAKGTVTIKGVAGHASEPESGCNAMVIAAKLINDIPIGRVDESTTSNIGIIHGGNATNIIMEQVVITFEVRSYDESKVIAYIKQISDQLSKLQKTYPIQFDNQIKQGTPGFCLEEDSPLLTKFTAACLEQGIRAQIKQGMGGSDANIFNKNGIPCSNISVGMTHAHSVNECIRKSDIIACRDLVLKMLT